MAPEPAPAPRSTLATLRCETSLDYGVRLGPHSCPTPMDPLTRSLNASIRFIVRRDSAAASTDSSRAAQNSPVTWVEHRRLALVGARQIASVTHPRRYGAGRAFRGQRALSTTQSSPRTAAYRCIRRHAALKPSGAVIRLMPLIATLLVGERSISRFHGLYRAIASATCALIFTVPQRIAARVARLSHCDRRPPAPIRPARGCNLISD